MAGRTALFVQNDGDSTIGAPFGPNDGGLGNDPDRATNWAGSLSILHKDSGLNLTGAGGVLIDPEEDGVAPDDEQEASFFFIRAGWTTKFTDLGKTHFAASYYSSNNENVSAGGTAFSDLDGEWFDVNIVQKVDKLSAEIYASYIRYEVDEATLATGAELDTQAINVIYAGSRIKF